MARALWNGTIGFGLVQIPMSLFPAESTNELEFHMVDKRDFSPIGFQRVNKKTGKEVEWKNIVKAHEHSKGRYVVLTDQDFQEANVTAARQMDILGFVDFDQIDPRYIDHPYYLAPQKAGKKAYALLRATLEKTGKAGVGKIVIRTRQHLAAVVALEEALVLVILRFADELRDTKGLDLPSKSLKTIGVTAKELSMAEQLVQGLSEDFEPEKYEDEYRHDLMKLIQRKVKAGEVNQLSEAAPAAKRKPAPTKIIDLASLLAESVADHGKGKARAKKAKTTKRHAA